MATPEEHDESNASVVVAMLIAALLIVVLGGFKWTNDAVLREPEPTQVLPDPAEHSLLVEPRR